MARDHHPIARIRLARSLPRLLALPLATLVIGAAIAALAATALPPPGTWIGLGAAGVLAIVAVLQAAWVLSIRLEVEESAVGVSWLGGGRIYPLSPGPVTRVRLRGAGASRLRARTGMLGWAIGPARLRDDERVEVVRLAPTATAILVPTERGRLAIAPADEGALLDALTRAARARQRLEEIAAAGTAPDEVARDTGPEPAEREAEAEPESIDGGEPYEPSEPAPMTGIERALLEQRLAEERAAAEAAAAERGDEGPIVEVPSPVEPEAALEPQPAMPVPVTAPPSRRRAVRRPQMRLRVRRPKPSAALVLVPLVGAGAAWALGVVTGRMPEPGSDLSRLTSLALVLAGPVTSVAALMALAWWPRLVAVVVTGGLVAALFVGRALAG